MSLTIHRNRLTYRLTFACLLVGALSSMVRAAETPVSVKASIQPTSQPTHYKVVVNMDIQEGWHTYDDPGPNGVSVRTTLKLELPDGMATVGDWDRPLSLPSAESADITVYEGQVEFTRTLQVNPADSKGDIGLKVRFQACTEKICQRPKTVSFTLVVPTQLDAAGGKSLFAAPVRLLAGNKVLVSGQSYPSPAVYDVDNDGQLELVIGTIAGSLTVHEQTGRGENGDPIWARGTALKTAEGNPVRVSNW